MKDSFRLGLDALLFNDVLKILSKINKSIFFKLSNDGLLCSIGDNASFCWIFFKRSAIEMLDLDSSLTFCLDVSDLKSAIGSAKSGIILIDVFSDEVVFSFGKSVVSIRQDDANYTSQDLSLIDGISFEVDLSVDSKDFESVLKSSTDICSSVLFVANEDGFFIKGEKDNKNSAFSFCVDDTSLSTYELKSKFGKVYLDKVVGFHKLSDSMIIKSGTNIPVLFNVDTSDISLNYIIAPMIDNK